MSGDAPAPEWRKSLEKTFRGGRKVVASSFRNACLILRNAPEWRGRLRLNAQDKSTRVDGREWQDADIGVLREYLEGPPWRMQVGVEIVDAAAKHVAREQAHHPLQDYLRGLKWDGGARLDTWLIKCARVDDDDDGYARAVSAKWMIGAVARALHPGCKADCVLVLEGAQGARKSTLVRALCRDDAWYAATDVTAGTKDSMQTCAMAWIIELEEGRSYDSKDIARTKAFLSRLVDVYRPPYGRNPERQPRSCAFMGTTNEAVYLFDDTGNRRTWPVWTPCTLADPIDVAWVEANRDQLWAEAAARHEAGETWHLTDPRVIEAAANIVDLRRKADVLEEQAAAVLEGCAKPMTLPEFCALLGHRLDPENARDTWRAARLLAGLGWRCAGTTRGGKHSRRRVYVPPTPTPKVPKPTPGQR